MTIANIQDNDNMTFILADLFKTVLCFIHAHIYCENDSVTLLISDIMNRLI